jgi:hypothetical protein
MSTGVTMEAERFIFIAEYQLILKLPGIFGRQGIRCATAHNQRKCVEALPQSRFFFFGLSLCLQPRGWSYGHAGFLRISRTLLLRRALISEKKESRSASHNRRNACSHVCTGSQCRAVRV